MSQPLKLLIPQPCPVPLIRVGGSGDGAYLVPDDLQGIQACFSPGVNNSKNFEDELVDRFDICGHLCDYTSDLINFKTPLIAGKQTFEKKWLEPVSSENSINLEDWVNRYTGDPADDLLLQMDIEGAEYRNLLGATEALLARFRIIVLELHGLLALVQQPADNDVAKLLTKLDATHVCVHAHPNNCCGEFIETRTGMNVPNVIELTYLRRDRIRIDSKGLLPPQLPHPQDIAFNIHGNPPLHLNEHWLNPNSRSEASTIKVLEDNQEFLQHSILVLRDREKTSQALANRLNKFSQIGFNNLYTEIGFDPSAHRRGSAKLDGPDRALGAPFFLSSAPPGAPRSGVVSASDTFFFQTEMGEHQSITVEFIDPMPLASLVIQNRKDAHQDRARNLFWVVHDDMRVDFSSVFPVLVSDGFHSDPNILSYTPLLKKVGRFLTVFSPAFTALHFASLHVYAINEG